MGNLVNFDEIKRIPLVQVLGHYKVKLHFNGKGVTALCPLKTHRAGEKDRTFSIHIDRNYWQCFSRSCNSQNGGRRGGDVIDLVALLEDCRMREAAEKLAEWFGIKSAPRMEERRVSPKEHASSKGYSDHKPASDSGQKYMADVERWFRELNVRREGENDAAYEKRVLNGIKSKLIESYRNGQSQASQRDR